MPARAAAPAASAPETASGAWGITGDNRTRGDGSASEEDKRCRAQCAQEASGESECGRAARGSMMSDCAIVRAVR
jgi:hypothetical protein